MGRWGPTTTGRKTRFDLGLRKQQLAISGHTGPRPECRRRHNSDPIGEAMRARTLCLPQGHPGTATDSTIDELLPHNWKPVITHKVRSPANYGTGPFLGSRSLQWASESPIDDDNYLTFLALKYFSIFIEARSFPHTGKPNNPTRLSHIFNFILLNKDEARGKLWFINPSLC